MREEGQVPASSWRENWPKLAKGLNISNRTLGALVGMATFPVFDFCSSLFHAYHIYREKYFWAPNTPNWVRGVALSGSPFVFVGVLLYATGNALLGLVKPIYYAVAKGYGLDDMLILPWYNLRFLGRQLAEKNDWDTYVESGARVSDEFKGDKTRNSDRFYGSWKTFVSGMVFLMIFAAIAGAVMFGAFPVAPAVVALKAFIIQQSGGLIPVTLSSSAAAFTAAFSGLVGILVVGARLAYWVLQTTFSQIGFLLYGDPGGRALREGPQVAIEDVVDHSLNRVGEKLAAAAGRQSTAESFSDSASRTEEAYKVDGAFEERPAYYLFEKPDHTPDFFEKLGDVVTCRAGGADYEEL